jgi:hypothetical protein
MPPCASFSPSPVASPESALSELHSVGPVAVTATGPTKDFVSFLDLQSFSF